MLIINLCQSSSGSLVEGPRRASGDDDGAGKGGPKVRLVLVGELLLAHEDLALVDVDGVEPGKTSMSLFTCLHIIGRVVVIFMSMV